MNKYAYICIHIHALLQLVLTYKSNRMDLKLSRAGLDHHFVSMFIVKWVWVKNPKNWMVNASEC